MDKEIAALHGAGVTADWILGLLFFSLVVLNGPKWIKTISDCVLAQKRFALEKRTTIHTIELQADERRQSEMRLELPNPSKGEDD